MMIDSGISEDVSDARAMKEVQDYLDREAKKLCGIPEGQSK